MVQLDYAVFLVAGVLGVLPVDGRLSWGIVGLWALLKLVNVI